MKKHLYLLSAFALSGCCLAMDSELNRVFQELSTDKKNQFLCKAAQDDNQDGVSKLLTKKNVNYKDRKGMSPILKKKVQIFLL